MATITTTTTATAVATTTATVVNLEGEAAVQLVKAIEDFNAAKQLLDELRHSKEDAEQIIRSLLGDAEIAKVAGVERVRVQHRTNSSFDRDLMKTAYPEAFEACLKITPYTVLKAQ